jgi:hypothetical protein
MNLGDTGRSILWFVVGVLVACASFVLLRPDLVSNSVTIESYPVRPEIARELHSVLRAALASASKEGTPLARVSLLPNGQLLVTAPASVQKGVQRILAEVESKQPEATPSIRFEAWLVKAKRGTQGEAANLTEVQPALDAISKAQGAPLHFELLENLSTRTRTGADESLIQGSHAGMKLELATVRRNDKNEPIIAADLRIWLSTVELSIPGRAIKTLAELRPGELLVVGQSGLAEVATAAPPGEEPQLYYIVRASI